MSRRSLPVWLQAPAEPVRTRKIRFDERTTPVRFTLRVMAGALRYTAPSALLSITHQLGEALVPVLMGIAIERAVSTGDVAQLLLWVGLLAADFAMLSFSWRFGSRLGTLGALAVQHELRSMVSTHLLTRQGARGVSAAPGVALSLATSDVNRLASAVIIGVYPVGQLAAVVFGGTVLLVISWPLGLAVLLGAPVVLWLTDRTGGSLRRRSGDEQGAAATAAGEAADLMSGYRVLKGFHAEDEAARRYRSASRSALASTLRARRAAGLFVGTMDLATGLFVTAITVAAGILALRGAFGIVELVTIVGLTQFLLEPLQGLARNAGTLWASANASAARLLDLLRESDDAASSAAVQGSDDGGRPGAVVVPLAGEVRDGELVAIAAEARAARTVLDLIRAGHPDALVVPHEAHLFAGSVRENVALSGVPDDRVDAALAAAGCDELAEILPQGWATPVGEGGAALSGGQRQRVALARALAQDAPLLVLHDPTTAVDAVTEAAIADRLRSLRAGRRTVVVTRSPALLQAADRVVTITGEDLGEDLGDDSGENTNTGESA
ncbi:ABC transporter transmembrane domain-containing protein [Promicromonospora sp. Populi]|uniref:ABC transporter transmembrane domain-containing protein n=1 Tax=Promicromonospora sp. Populi TaxID=3239420 RepID=UPI0034E228DF